MVNGAANRRNIPEGPVGETIVMTASRAPDVSRIRLKTMTAAVRRIIRSDRLSLITAQRSRPGSFTKKALRTQAEAKAQSIGIRKMKIRRIVRKIGQMLTNVRTMSFTRGRDACSFRSYRTWRKRIARPAATAMTVNGNWFKQTFTIGIPAIVAAMIRLGYIGQLYSQMCRNQ